MKGTVYYQELEPEFWLIHGDFEYKANVYTRRVIDNSTPLDYHFITLIIYGVDQKSALINGLSFTNCSWLVFKADAWSSACQFKGTKELAFTFFFSDNWLKQKWAADPAFAGSDLQAFFQSEAKYMIIPDEAENCSPFIEAIRNNFQETSKRTEADQTLVRDNVLGLMTHLCQSYETGSGIENMFDIPDKDRKIVTKAEKILLDHLTRPFPGIEPIAKEVGVSATKLKADFKKAFNLTLYQYFHQKQMIVAREILLQKEVQIKELSKSIGYENASKFAAAFKKQFGILPSELKQ